MHSRKAHWLFYLNHWIHHTKWTWEPTVHTREFHILMIMKDSSVSHSTERLSIAKQCTIPYQPNPRSCSASPI